MLLLALSAGSMLNAQIAHEGEPFQWKIKTISLEDIPGVVTEKLDMAAIEAEDRVVDQYKETPYRFGIEHEVSIDVLAEGKFTLLKKGDKLWQYAITCPAATSVNLLFSQWHLPVGGQVTIWNADRTEFLGAYTHENNQEWGSLAVGVIHTDKIVVEYYEQAEVAEQARLEIGTIVHGYRAILNKWEVVEKGPYGNSGNCNMNVNCPDGSTWQNEKRGVALILNGGSAWCTGSLINNTAQDGTPYFLTAAHCNATESNWVFYFNHESATCTGTTGPTNQSISGATQIASGTASDYHLIQLSSPVPSSYNPYYNGWDRSNSPVSTAVGIHHPSGDIKKISFDDDPLTKTNYSSNTVTSAGTHWRIEAWERNTTTEGGSSGSPLFDQNHRIIGQLHGGAAACGNTLSDWYGAFGNSWSGLSAYLDPLGTGAMTLNGLNGGGTTATCSDGIQNQGETGIDCGGPNCAPCAGCTDVTINYNTIEAGWGIWTDGGTDAARVTDATNSYSPSNSLRIRDNTSTSLVTTTSQNFTSYANLTVEFVFRGVGMETGEDFWLQISTNGGTTYTTVASYVFNASLLNSTFYAATVPIAGPFTSTTRLRFRCDASDDTDQVFIDNIRIRGCQNPAVTGNVASQSADNFIQSDAQNEVFSLYPNPANDMINLSFEAELTGPVSITVLDMQGKIIRNETVVPVQGVNVFNLDTSSLIDGFYLIQMSSNDIVHTKRFMVSR